MEKFKTYFSKSAIALMSITGIRNLITKIAIFQQPKQCGYIFRERVFQKDIFDFYLTSQTGIISNPDIAQEWVEYQAFKLYTTRDKDVVHMNPVIYFKYKKSQTKKCILFSHGNASDLSDIWKFAICLSILYGTDVLAYDYTGYGLSPNKPSETNILQDAELMMSFLIKNLGYKLEDIIVCGFSLGSYPSTYLAKKYQNICGLILLSPLASVLSWVDQKSPWQKFEELKYYNNDSFSNLKLIHKVHCKIIIIHGTCDEIIPIRHSDMLFKKYLAKKEQNQRIVMIPFDNVNHNNISLQILNFENEISLFIYEQIKKFALQQIDLTCTYHNEVLDLHSKLFTLRDIKFNGLATVVSNNQE